ncbi:MAG: alpha/beta hydrolase [Alphaproteobacteria bacterium]|nr:alpha/beta hydrolase [Alphaproteobacteria bacterium]HCQ71135.1 alpha/beta hydrolase [Rhodospirillaceae bacterium]
MHSFKSERCEIFYTQSGKPLGEAPIVVWGHGWGQDHRSFDGLVAALSGVATHIAVDFPGFGRSPVPFDTIEQSWGSGDYAHALSELIRSVAGGAPVIWVGHSFGARVGTQLGALYPDMMAGMVFVAGAGLKRKRSAWQKMILKTKIYTYKLGKWLKRWPFLSDLIESIQGASKIGSSDYQNAGAMRGVLVSVVNEHLSDEAARIQCPVLLIYGENDAETPPDVGLQFNQLIKDSELVSLSGQDHYSVLNETGRHQVAQRIKYFVQNLDG